MTAGRVFLLFTASFVGLWGALIVVLSLIDMIPIESRTTAVAVLTVPCMLFGLFCLAWGVSRAP